MQVRSATIGIIILLLRKSRKSKICLPKIVTWLRSLYPKTENIPKTNENPATMIQAGILLTFHFSIITETIVSISEIEDVSAAKTTSTKKYDSK